MNRSRWTSSFLWIAVLSWGIALGAKLFDLLILAGAWGASPPASLALYPYGPRWQINPGDFFQPLSALILIASVGALIGGCKISFRYRVWLWIPVISFTLIWIATPTVFWPLIGDLYGVATGRHPRPDAETVDMVRRWFLYDWLRIAAIVIGFVASIRAISMPAHSDR